MRTRVVIQARLSSSRLPGKALLPVGGMPLIELVARRAARTGHEVVVATSAEASDDLLAAHCTRVGLSVVRGPLDDVLARFVVAAQGLADDDLVVRLTGDNPVVDAGLVDELIDAVTAAGRRYGRVEVERVPYGLGAEVFFAGDLRRAADETTAAFDREHVTPWLRRAFAEVSLVPTASPGGSPAYRCTVDCLDDYERIAGLFAVVDDPVGTPWVRLIASLAPTGPDAAPVDREGALLSSVVVAPPAASAGESLRALFAEAARRGVTHALCGPGEASTFATRTLPALRERLGALVTLPRMETPIDGPAHLAWQVRAGVERAMAQVQQRRLAGVLFASAEDAFAGDGGAWTALLDYVADGLVAEPGVVLTEPEHAGVLASLPGLRLVVVDAADPRLTAPQASDQLTALAQTVTVLARVGADPDAARAALGRPWVDAVVVDATSRAELDAVLAALARR